MWFAALACAVLLLIDTLPFSDDEDRDKGLQDCGYKWSHYKCYHSTKNAQVSTLAKMDVAVIGFIL